jgi:hypothetical protein
MFLGKEAGGDHDAPKKLEGSAVGVNRGRALRRHAGFPAGSSVPTSC